MAIQEIKTRLSIQTVLSHYGLQANSHDMLNCPFHADKTPSMKVYGETNTVYCFSGNCPSHGKSLDVIDFIMYSEQSSKGEAIEKARQLSGDIPLKITPPPNNKMDTLARTAVLTKMFSYFKNAVASSKPAQDYLKQRNLDPTKTEVGYNTAQFHHGTRKEESLIQSCVTVGLLTPWGTNSRVGGQAYKPFGKECIAFPLKNKEGNITGLYFRSTTNNEDQKHFYLKDSEGLYPNYPSPQTEKLLLTEAIIDAATLLQVPKITSQYTVLAAYGTNRLTAEHIEAIKTLPNLKEIIFAFDNDDAGNKATEKYSIQLKEILPELIFSKLELEKDEDLNSTGQSHESEIFLHLLENRIFIFSNGKETPIEKNKISEQKTLDLQPSTLNLLNTKNPFKIIYKTDTANYYIQGGVGKTLESMKITLVVEHPESLYKTRNKLDLYEDKQVEKTAKEVSEKLSLRRDLIELDLYKLTDLLDSFREKELESMNNSEADEKDIIIPMTQKEKEQLADFVKQANVIPALNVLLGKAGIVGEEKNRIFLLIIAASYKMPETLHALIQGSSGSGKTRLLKQISDCIPREKVTKLTRVSDKVLYNYPEKYFVNRLLCLEDIDGLSEEAEFAFRELQSNGELNSATSSKLENGQIVAGQKTVKGPIASMCCTTRGEIYEDNMSRVFLIAVDESPGQTKRIIEYQNNKAAGLLDHLKEQQVKRFIQHFIRALHPLEVVNPYANKIQLPQEAHKIRRLNDLFQNFVKMVTLLNQHQRSKDNRNRLLTQTADLGTAVGIMFESIVLKVDELDGSLRQFYENLKGYLKKTYPENTEKIEFTQREIRQAFNISKSQCSRYFIQLVELEYMSVKQGHNLRRVTYRIDYWDNYLALRTRIKTDLENQLKQLKE